MLGMTGAVALVLARLQSEMPAKITELTSRYSLPAGALQNPGSYMVNMFDRVELSQYPTIQVAPRGEGAPRMNDQDQGVFNYETSYMMRVYLQVRGVGYEMVEQRRQLMTLGIRELLLSSPMLGAAPDIWILPGSIQTTYFGIGELKEDEQRSIAATYTDLTVMVEEMTELPSPWPNTADTVLGKSALIGQDITTWGPQQ